jgi:hypothetical protein
MSEATGKDAAAIRAEGAAEERSAILEIIERAMRQLTHGHGAGGAQVLHQIVEEIRSRG